MITIKSAVTNYNVLFSQGGPLPEGTDWDTLAQTMLNMVEMRYSQEEINEGET